MKNMYIIVIVLLTSWTAGSWADWVLPCPVTICPYPPGKYAVNLPHENDCTKFYKCDWGVPILQDCPSMDPNNKERKLHYNRRLQVCDWPWQAGCEACTEASIDDKCPPPDKISDSNDCNYIDCKNNQTIACPNGECFSRTCQACVKNPANGKCSGDPCIPCCEGDRRKHGDCDCTLYDECINKEWRIQECKNGEHYNPETKKCGDPIGCGVNRY
ncbi:hypothetical protein ACFW04_008404 [Cataglyphis niger]